MKYPRVAVISLSDNSFFICVPLFDKEMRDFKRELSFIFQERGESIQTNRRNGVSFLTVLTTFSKDEIERISNYLLKKIKRRKQRKNAH